MIGVGEKDLDAEVFEILLRLALYGGGRTTGMNAGVSMTPCGVVSRPSRAPDGSVANTSNRKPIRASVSGKCGCETDGKKHEE